MAVSEGVWHRRLAHLGMDNVKRLASMVDGMHVAAHDGDDAHGVCATCQLANQRALPHHPSPSLATGPLDLVHCDVWGPAQVESAGGTRYFVSLLDDHSKMSVVVPLKLKSAAAAALKQVIVQLEVQLERRVKAVRSDRGGEFMSTELSEFFAERGIQWQPTAPYSPESNGAAERLNQTLLVKVRSMLLDSGMAKRYWAEALGTANYLRNRSPVRGFNETPFERFYGRKPDFSHLRVFGCLGYALVSPKSRRKLDPTAEECWLMGYDPAGAYRVLLEGGAVQVRRDVTWDETVVYKLRHKPQEHVEVHELIGGAGNAEIVGGFAPGPVGAPIPAMPAPDLPVVHGDLHSEISEVSDKAIEPGNTVSGNADDVLSGDSGDFVSAGSGNGNEEGLELVGAAPAIQPTGPGPPPEPVGRVLRDRSKIKPPERLANLVQAVYDTDPKGYTDAMCRPDADNWKQAMEEELNSHATLGSWTVVDRPADERVLPSMWVFTKKVDAQGRVVRYKARIVIQGNHQRPGVDFGEVFAPVSRYATLRVLLAMVARDDLELHQLDVKTAFLNAELDRDVYAYPPQGSGVPAGKVLLLKRAVYGLRQAPRAWFEKLKAHLETIGFVPSSADPSLYVLDKDGVRCFLLVYVDDLLLACSQLSVVQDVKKHITAAFEARDMGEASTFLGYEITRNRAELELVIRQSGLVREYAVKFGAQKVKKRSVPIPAGTVLLAKEDGEAPSPDCYSELLGSLLYLAGGTRPDISFAVGALSRFSSNPSRKHWDVLRGVLAYVVSTSMAGIRYDGKSAAILQGFSDSDYAADKIRRKSVTGFVFTMCGGALVWSSKQQSAVALSTAESEYTAAAQASKEALWLRNLLIDLGEVAMSVHLYMDNQAAIDWIENPVVSVKSKHVDVHVHAVRDFAARGLLSVQHLGTEEMAADMLTKVVSPPQHNMCCKAVGMIGL